jgi:hypothetical protein
MTKFTEERLRFLAKDYDGPRIVKDLAARVIELEAENKRLREGLQSIVDFAPAYYSHRERRNELVEKSNGIYDSGILEGVGLCKDIARAALKGGE